MMVEREALRTMISSESRLVAVGQASSRFAIQTFLAESREQWGRADSRLKCEKLADNLWIACVLRSCEINSRVGVCLSTDPLDG
jgi:hypothetical protein